MQYDLEAVHGFIEGGAEITIPPDATTVSMKELTASIAISLCRIASALETQDTLDSVADSLKRIARRGE